MRFASFFVVGLFCVAVGCATAPASFVHSTPIAAPPLSVQQPNSTPPENIPFATVGSQKVSKQHLCLLILWPLKADESRGTAEEYWSKLQHWKQRLVEDALLANQTPAWTDALRSNFQQEQAAKWGAIIADDPVFSSQNPLFWDQVQKARQGCNVDDAAWLAIQERTWLAKQALASVPPTDRQVLLQRAMQYFRDLFSSVTLRYVRVSAPLQKIAELTGRMTPSSPPWKFGKDAMLLGTPHYWGTLTVSARDRMAEAFYESRMRIPHGLVLAALTARPKTLLGPFSLGTDTLYATVDKRTPWTGKLTAEQIEWYASRMRQEQARAGLPKVCEDLLKGGNISVDDAFLTNHFSSIFKGVSPPDHKQSNLCGDK